MAWLAQQSKGRFTLVYTPKYGSWLNLVEGFLQARPLRASPYPRRFPAGAGPRILAEIDRINRRPVVHTWKWRIAEPK